MDPVGHEMGLELRFRKGHREERVVVVRLWFPIPLWGRGRGLLRRSFGQKIFRLGVICVPRCFLTGSLLGSGRWRMSWLLHRQRPSGGNWSDELEWRLVASLVVHFSYIK